MDSGNSDQAAWLDQVEHQLRSEKPMERAQALSELLARARTDPTLHDRARLAFHAALERDNEPWGLSSAAQGIELVDGPQAALEAWRTLLSKDDANVVAYAVIAMNRPEHLQPMLDLLGRRREPYIRLNAISALGRLRDRRSLPILIAELENPAVRPHAIAALAALGDPSAAPQIRRFLGDRAAAWPVDNHGPMMSVGDVAAEALQKLRAAAGPQTDRTSAQDTAAFDAWVRSADARLLGQVQSLASRLWAFAPLLLALFEVIWIGILASRGSDGRGSTGPTREDYRIFDLLGAIPVLIGFSLGLYILIRRAGRPWIDLIAAALGAFLCACWLIAFAREFML